MLYKEDKKIIGVNIGNRSVGRIYKGGSLIWSKDTGPGIRGMMSFKLNEPNPANITRSQSLLDTITEIMSKMGRYACRKTGEGEVTICKLDPTNSNYYSDGSMARLTGEDGDIMVYKPAFNYKFEGNDGTQFSYSLSSSEIPLDGWIYSPASLIGAYKSYCDGSRLYSRSGVAPTGSITQLNNIAYAKARGTGYNIIDFEQHCMIALLFYAKYGTRDSQAVLGAGGVNYSSANGTTNAIGNADTMKTILTHASFAGIEGVHGGAYEWAEGLTIQGDVWTVTNPDGTTRTSNAPPVTSGSWVQEIAASFGPYFDVIPILANGSTSTYYADYYDYNKGHSVFVRSHNGTSANGGVSYVNMSRISSFTSPNLGSRLAFRGNIKIENDVSKFKSSIETVRIGNYDWATSNLDTWGTFAANEYDYGRLYQFGSSAMPAASKVAWPGASNTAVVSASNPGFSYTGTQVNTFNYPDAWSSVGGWTAENDPCPDGFQVPTWDHWADLLANSTNPTALETVGGISGRRFTSKANPSISLFLPVSGYRRNASGALYDAILGHYWSSTPNPSSATLGYYLYFYGGTAAIQYNLHSNLALAVRCVRKTS